MKFIVFAFMFLISSIVSASEFKNVALVSVSTQYEIQKIDVIKDNLRKAGYVVTERYLDQVVSDFGYVNTDQVRAESLVNALLDSDVDIVWFVRGGGGALNLLPYLYREIDRLKKVKPKVLVGFSDVTAIHSFVNEYLSWTSLHSVVASYNADMRVKGDQTIFVNDMEPLPSVEKVFNEGVSYDKIVPLNSEAKNGIKGELRGGNLTLVAACFATKYQPNFSNKVLLLEDVGTSFRQLDRSLQQILFMRQLDINAIVFGQFYPLDPTDGQRLIYKRVIEEFARNFDKPVYYYPFIGHGRVNHPVMLGAQINITCRKNTEYCTLDQKRVIRK